jgi:hypothetical protein
MKKRLTSFLQVALLFAAIFAMPFSANSATQRVVLEDHTGTWCGWCPSGIQAIEDLKVLHGDKFLPVAMHNGDPMATAFQGELSSILGIANSGYPAGSINRLPINTGQTNVTLIAPGHNQGNKDGDQWGSIIKQVLTQAPMVDVTSVYSLNKTTREITLDVTCEILKDVNAQLALNAIVVEDKVSGSGTGWQQHSYLSANSNFPNHPWYAKPADVSMSFDDVFRYNMAGNWGALAGMPGQVKAGQKYTLRLTSIVPAGINLNNIRIYGICQQVGTGQFDRVILNGVQSEVGVPMAVKVATSGAAAFSITDNSKSADKTFDVSNKTGETVNFEVSYLTSNRTPKDWTVDISNPKFDVASGANVATTVKFNVKSVGIGDIKVAIKGSNGYYSEEIFTTLSSSVERVELDMEGGAYANKTILDKTSYKNFIVLGTNEFQALASMKNNLKVVVASTGQTGQLTANEMTALWNLYNSGVPVYINGGISEASMVINGATNPLVTNLGLTWVNATNAVGVGGSGQPTTFNVEGVPSDPISDGFISSGAILSGGYVLYSGGTSKSSTIPFLKFKSTTTTNGAAMGMRADNGKARIAILTFNPFTMPDAKRTELTEKIMNWLTNTTSAPKAVLSVSDSKLDFGKVPTNKSVDKMFSISNTGGGELTVNTLSLDFGDNYKFATGTPTTPFKIAAGQKVEITVVFSPTSVESGLSDGISIETDAPADANTTIELTGEGVAAAGKAPLISVASTISFEKTDVNKTSEKTLTIANKGDDNLTITKFEMFSSNFEFTTAPITPMVVNAGENVQLKVVFKPTEAKMYTTMLHITSNDPNNGMVMINLDGQGAVANSVDENGVAGNSAIFTMSAGPNPFAEMTNLKYTLAGNVAKNVEITLVNSAGSKVATIVNQSQNPGDYNISYKGTELAQGTYYFIANVAGYTTQLPVVITK